MPGLSDIPREVSGNELGENVLNIFDKNGIDISPVHIQSCHQLKKRYGYCQVF